MNLICACCGQRLTSIFPLNRYRVCDRCGHVIIGHSHHRPRIKDVVLEGDLNE
jgi:DNA-directed RNA polymerase subunit RPC12/RpoP